jgi:hypothetical protein
MKEFKIKAGKHRSGYFFRPVFGNTILTFNATFKDGCQYDIGLPDQLDINKLIGLSYGYHHSNSVRIGWRYNTTTNKIDLLAYIYRNKERLTEDTCPVIASVDINETVYGMISYERKQYRIILYTESDVYNEVCYDIYNTKLPKIGYVLFPYFGGNQVAPHDMSINIEYSLIRG